MFIVVVCTYLFFSIFLCPIGMADATLIEINEITGYWSYLKSIDWQDPWLIGLIVFHGVITLTALLTRNNTNFQIFLFLVLLSAVYFSEGINEYAASNWSSFSKQQYFDSSGLFISTIFSIPILLNCMLLIGSWLYNSTELMSKLKAAQLQQKLREQRLRNSQAEMHEKMQ